MKVKPVGPEPFDRAFFSTWKANLCSQTRSFWASCLNEKSWRSAWCKKAELRRRRRLPPELGTRAREGGHHQFFALPVAPLPGRGHPQSFLARFDLTESRILPQTSA